MVHPFYNFKIIRTARFCYQTPKNEPTPMLPTPLPESIASLRTLTNEDLKNLKTKVVGYMPTETEQLEAELQEIQSWVDSMQNVVPLNPIGQESSDLEIIMADEDVLKTAMTEMQALNDQQLILTTLIREINTRMAQLIEQHQTGVYFSPEEFQFQVLDVYREYSSFASALFAYAPRSMAFDNQQMTLAMQEVTPAYKQLEKEYTEKTNAYRKKFKKLHEKNMELNKLFMPIYKEVIKQLDSGN